MENQMLVQQSPAHPKLYTLEQAASYLVVREDDLNALLPDTTVVPDALRRGGFTPTDVEILEQFIRDIRKFATESVYGGGDL